MLPHRLNKKPKEKIIKIEIVKILKKKTKNE